MKDLSLRSFGIGKGSGVDLSSLCLGSKGAQQNPEANASMLTAWKVLEERTHKGTETNYKPACM